VAVVYDNAARRQGRGDIQPICAALAERNVPFTVIVAGDDWLDYRLDPHRLAGFKTVIVTKDLALDDGQRKLLDKVKAEHRLLVCSGPQQADALAPRWVRVEGTDKLLVVLRVRPDDSAAPLAIHLLNRAYDKQKDAVTPLKEFRLRLRQDLLGTRTFNTARLHSPRAGSVPLKVQSDGENTVITIPGMDFWSIVELGEKGR
jgi:hypothetical protein